MTPPPFSTAYFSILGGHSTLLPLLVSIAEAAWYEKRHRCTAASPKTVKRSEYLL